MEPTPSKHDTLLVKAHEISYALMRVAVYIRRHDFRSRIESSSLNLLEQISARRYEAALEIVTLLTNFLKLGFALYEVETLNARSLLSELAHFDSAIRQSFGFDQLPDIAQFFSPSGNSAKSDEQRHDTEEGSVQSEEMEVAHDDNKPPVDTMMSIGATIRHSAILERIRKATLRDESGNISGCRMKDLLTDFPDVSERTLRYDLERLLGQGLIERIGAGGPSLFYVIK